MNSYTLLFDFDGTIADSLDTIITTFDRIADRFSFAKSTEDDKVILRHEGIRVLVKKKHIPFFILPFILRAIKKELQRHIGDIPLIPGIKDALLTIKSSGYALGIVTSNERENVSAFLRLHGLDIFDFIECEMNIFGKGRMLKNVIRRKKLYKSRTLYIGDEIRDVQAAREAGIPIIAVSWGFSAKDLLLKSHPDFLCTHPSSLPSLIRQICKS